ncbi:hypothetical protein C1H46_026563 [Malus baccata]|uniref:Uncharacterized protein n=1 Tax=Malus baccata TaxID=106549 RepID=A0A540LMZ8_MALBA|nr:hypothetical protein C1H46_026563 [Malus baccata]
MVVFRLFEATTHPGEKQECMHVDALDGLPSAEFMTRSSTDHLSIKPPNLICDCISPKMQQQSVQHDVQPINIKKKHKKLQGNPNFKKLQPGKKVWLLNSNFKLIPGRQESRWKSPYMVMQVFQNGNLDIEIKGKGCMLKVKKYLLKPFIRKFSASESSTLKEQIT